LDTWTARKWYTHSRLRAGFPSPSQSSW